MGYNITIGEACFDKNPEYATDDGGVLTTANGVRHDNAPAFGEPTDYTNERWPSYTAWADFMEKAGLSGVNLMAGGHPGLQLVTKEVRDAVHEALTLFKARNPGIDPGYEDGQSPTLARLVWLDYWLTWALENCETPVIANS